MIFGGQTGWCGHGFFSHGPGRARGGARRRRSGQAPERPGGLAALCFPDTAPTMRQQITDRVTLAMRMNIQSAHTHT